MKRLFVCTLCAALSVLTLPAAPAAAAKPEKDQKILDIRPDKTDGKVPSATEWQNANRAAVDAATAPAVLMTFLKDDAAADALCGAVKTAYQTDAMKATQLAAVTQFVMTSAGEDFRKLWVGALIRAARKATAADVTCFFLDQLRWCGSEPRWYEFGADIRAIRSFTTSKDPSVASLAVMLCEELAGKGIGAAD